MTNTNLGALVLVGLIAFAGQATALTDAQKCQATKLKRAGQYNFCRLKAEGKAVKTGDPVDYTKCNLKFTTKWADAEAIPMCPTTGDVATIQARVTGDANDVASCLSGACPPSCGDGIADGAESCDGSDLDGETCATLGFGIGTLACTSGCGFDVSGCQNTLKRTGQAQSFGPGSDGDVLAGTPLVFYFNGDGTFSDPNTGLMWEMKSNDGGIHDVNIARSWCYDSFTPNPDCDNGVGTMDGTMVTGFLDILNDVGGGGANCFAGHCDWRIPNRRELESLVYLGTNPAGLLNFYCTPGCSIPACSCTQSDIYWSSSTYSPDQANSAWYVDFSDGKVDKGSKGNNAFLRAVRGGL